MYSLLFKTERAEHQTKFWMRDVVIIFLVLFAKEMLFLSLLEKWEKRNEQTSIALKFFISIHTE